jgi:uncharacterized membrane protein YgaE (UPF0421/DUF939 family)
MDILLLIKSFIVLIVMLGILVIFLVSRSKKKQKIYEKRTKEEKVKEIVSHEFNDFLTVIKNRQASSEELKKALDGILEYHGTIPAKLGIRLHPEFYKYSEVILRLCRHKQTNKDLIINFYKKLSKRNPSYAKEIDDSLTKGINSLGM